MEAGALRNDLIALHEPRSPAGSSAAAKSPGAAPPTFFEPINLEGGEGSSEDEENWLVPATPSAAGSLRSSVAGDYALAGEAWQTPSEHAGHGEHSPWGSAISPSPSVVAGNRSRQVSSGNQSVRSVTRGSRIPRPGAPPAPSPPPGAGAAATSSRAAPQRASLQALPTTSSARGTPLSGPKSTGSTSAAASNPLRASAPSVTPRGSGIPTLGSRLPVTPPTASASASASTSASGLRRPPTHTPTGYTSTRVAGTWGSQPRRSSVSGTGEGDFNFTAPGSTGTQATPSKIGAARSTSPSGGGSASMALPNSARLASGSKFSLRNRNISPPASTGGANELELQTSLELPASDVALTSPSPSNQPLDGGGLTSPAPVKPVEHWDESERERMLVMLRMAEHVLQAEAVKLQVPGGQEPPLLLQGAAAGGAMTAEAQPQLTEEDAEAELKELEQQTMSGETPREQEAQGEEVDQPLLQQEALQLVEKLLQAEDADGDAAVQAVQPGSGKDKAHLHSAAKRPWMPHHHSSAHSSPEQRLAAVRQRVALPAAGALAAEGSDSVVHGSPVVSGGGAAQAPAQSSVDGPAVSTGGASAAAGSAGGSAPLQAAPRSVSGGAASSSGGASPAVAAGPAGSAAVHTAAVHTPSRLSSAAGAGVSSPPPAASAEHPQASSSPAADRSTLLLPTRTSAGRGSPPLSSGGSGRALAGSPGGAAPGSITSSPRPPWKAASPVKKAAPAPGAFTFVKAPLHRSSKDDEEQLVGHSGSGGGAEHHAVRSAPATGDAGTAGAAGAPEEATTSVQGPPSCPAATAGARAPAGAEPAGPAAEPPSTADASKGPAVADAGCQLTRRVDVVIMSMGLLMDVVSEVVDAQEKKKRPAASAAQRPVQGAAPRLVAPPAEPSPQKQPGCACTVM